MSNPEPLFQYHGELAALATAVCWTFTSLSFEAAGKRIGSMCVNLIRLVFALIFLTVLCWILRGRPAPTDATLEMWGWLALSAVFGFCICDLCLFRALVLIGPRVAMLIMSLVPPFTALTGWLIMGEVLKWNHWLGMALTVSGVGWVVLERKRTGEGKKGGLSLDLWGIALVFIAAIGQAVGLVLSKKGTLNYDPFQATQIRVITGVVGFMIIFTCINWWPKFFKAIRHKSGMAFTTLGAFWGPFLGVSLSLVAVKYTESGIAATIMSITPVLLIPIVIFFYKKKVSLRAIIGAVVAVLGVALLFLPKA
ncbi:MAG: DMT family transporter [Planctomycetota bacterium]|nr:MAG: DMT family transporter [Planctomycetota bacterium]